MPFRFSGRLIKGKENEFEDMIDTIKMCVTGGCASFKFNICEPVVAQEEGSGLSEAIFENDKLYDEFIEICKIALPEVNMNRGLFK